MTRSLPVSDPDPVVSTNDRRKAAVAATVTVVLWASAFVAIRGIGHAFSPAPLALLRLAVATAALAVLVPLSYRRLPRLPTSRRSLVLVAAYGVLWLAGYTVALNAAEQHLDAGTAALLVNLAPLLIAFGAGMFLGESRPRTLIVGSFVALAGIAVISMDSGGGGDWLGVGLCLLAALLYAAGVLIQKVALRSVDAAAVTLLGCALGTAALLPWTPQLVGELGTASPGALAGGIYLGLFPTAIGFSTWAYALRRTEAGRMSATTYAVPAVSVLLSWLLLSEVPTGYGLAGGALCLAGVAIARRRTR
ncbi:drug/metabolite transporter (DMT)-like permease [Saccharomonospora amisosensis]|uniref:Drug/metabolite transporter (DMT)-like permease n=1 Tax=Saccharomonospora amisosensis TaxID=1128677 RepID=A0A7X5UPA4_9PSEU|nr:DMT family transporter [Saccharomonospora amisosensis]NIJ11704.1 drug/metabolite transporter (DMT)-like permease [Saccharomonospora amisosensis]